MKFYIRLYLYLLSLMRNWILPETFKIAYWASTPSSSALQS